MADKKQYPLGRDFHASARLQLQHLLWTFGLGYLLHPLIPVTSPTIRVADIGTGNAIWPIELSRKLPPTAQIIGYDVSAAMFPMREWLPENVKLELLDVLAETMPEELVGAFDVVHIRAFVCVIKGGDPSRVMERMVAMLKPGGYLQWDEVDVGAYAAQPPNAKVTAPASKAIAQLFREYIKDNGFETKYLFSNSSKSINPPDPDLICIAHRWAGNLPKYFSAAGLTDIHPTHLHLGDSYRKFETEDHLMALEDVVPDIARHMAQKRGIEVQAMEVEMAKTLQAVVEEAGKGVSLKVEWYSCVGRKWMRARL